MEPPANLTDTLLAWLQLIWLSTALGIFVGAISERSEVFERVWHTVTYLIFPLSGAVFMVEWLPSTARQYVLIIPMVHAVELVRGGYFGNHVIGHGSHSYLAAVNLSLTLIGLVLTADVSKRVEPE
jgi:capsular polysaccharide transport system permease protein